MVQTLSDGRLNIIYNMEQYTYRGYGLLHTSYMYVTIKMVYSYMASV